MRLNDFVKMKIPVVEIFNSISGEGISAGSVATFIRTAGCNLRCSYCDTVYGYDETGDGNKMLTPDEIVHIVDGFACSTVICTGGEPLEVGKPKRYIPLYLAQKGYKVRIETNGSCPLYSDEELRGFGLEANTQVNYSLDIKCPSSNMSMGNIFEDNFSKLKEGDELKFIVGSDEDIEYSLNVTKKYKDSIALNKIVVNFSPVFGVIEPRVIVAMLCENSWYFEQNLLSVRLSLQIHKVIWPPNARGV
jgi:7-carboxy-7-deazaguanine synthase